jgi:hypothetical protein
MADTTVSLARTEAINELVVLLESLKVACGGVTDIWRPGPANSLAEIPMTVTHNWSLGSQKRGRPLLIPPSLERRQQRKDSHAPL